MSFGFQLIAEGVSEMQAEFAREEKAFRIDLRKRMRGAVNILRRGVRSEVRSKFTLGRGKRDKFLGAIGSKVTGSGAELEGRVGIRGRRQYYGVHETGVTIVPKQKGKKYRANRSGKDGHALRRSGTQDLLIWVDVRGGRFGGWASKPRVVIPARPFLEPTLAKDGDAAVNELGEAFGVYQG